MPSLAQSNVRALSATSGCISRTHTGFVIYSADRSVNQSPKHSLVTDIWPTGHLLYNATEMTAIYTHTHTYSHTQANRWQTCIYICLYIYFIPYIPIIAAIYTCSYLPKFIFCFYAEKFFKAPIYPTIYIGVWVQIQLWKCFSIHRALLCFIAPSWCHSGLPVSLSIEIVLQR